MSSTSECSGSGSSGSSGSESQNWGKERLYYVEIDVKCARETFTSLRTLFPGAVLRGDLRFWERGGWEYLVFHTGGSGGMAIRFTSYEDKAPSFDGQTTPRSGVQIGIEVEDIEQLRERVQNAGHRLFEGPDRPDGEVSFEFEDGDGTRWMAGPPDMRDWAQSEVQEASDP